MTKCRVITLSDGSQARVQTVNGKPLPASDLAEIEKFVAYVKARNRRKQINPKQSNEEDR